MKKFFAVIFAFFFSVSFLHSQRIISPVVGTFSNLQSLVLNLSDDCEAFYSYTSSNPLESGFAYDGPVLLDITGDVKLTVVIVKTENPEEEIEEYTVNYSVSQLKNPFPENSDEFNFIEKISNRGILLCNSENDISIPESLKFAIGDGEKPFLPGKILSVSKDNLLFRYVPCTVKNETDSWRFIIHLSPSESKTDALTKSQSDSLDFNYNNFDFTDNNVPFKITDWEKFTFTGKNLIWCVDDGMWSASKEEIKIDRTVSHIIYWQDVAYTPENAIKSFVLPPKPRIETESFENKVFFNIDGDLRYKMSIKSNGTTGDLHEDNSLHSKICFASIEGECVDSEAVFAFYCDGVYQGNILCPYVIDRQPPLPPKFLSSESGDYARHDVRLKIETEGDSEIYYSVSEPVLITSISYNENLLENENFKKNAFSLYNNQVFLLRSGGEKTVAYSVEAYAKDSYGNISETSAYRVIIDGYNYYINSSSDTEFSDGSLLHPYKTFDQVLSVINNENFVHFFLTGPLEFPDNESVILSNCSFTGLENASFIFPDAAYLTVRDSSLQIQNIVIQKQHSEEKASSDKFFVFENSAVSFEDCEIFASSKTSLTAFYSNGSTLSLKNSGLALVASIYSCLISAENSSLSLEESRFSSVADTAVNFSIKGGSFELNLCECKVSAHLGRVLEASDVNLKLCSNKYSGDFDKETRLLKPVWKDESSVILEDKNNISEGF